MASGRSRFCSGETAHCTDSCPVTCSCSRGSGEDVSTGGLKTKLGKRQKTGDGDRPRNFLCTLVTVGTIIRTAVGLDCLPPRLLGKHNMLARMPCSSCSSHAHPCHAMPCYAMQGDGRQNCLSNLYRVAADLCVGRYLKKSLERRAYVREVVVRYQ